MYQDGGSGFVARPSSKIRRENSELAAAVARDGLTTGHAETADRLVRDAALSGTITPDYDARASLRDIIRYWSAILSAVEDHPALDIELHPLDPHPESAEPAPSSEAEHTEAPRPIPAATLISALKAREALEEVLVRDAVIAGTQEAPLKIHNVKLINSRLVGGTWKHVEHHGRRPEWTESRFAAVTFDHVIADRVSATDTLFDRVQLFDCQFEAGASFEFAVVRNSLKAERTSFAGASFRMAKLVHSVDAQTDSLRLAFDVVKAPAPIAFIGCNLNGAIFDRATLSGVSFAGCDLRGATFHNTILHGVDFRGAIVDDTDFTGLANIPTWAYDPGAMEGAKIADAVRATMETVQ